MPNDPGWPGQWGLRLAGFPQLWQLAAPNAHPVIATIDTGARSSFPDLRGQLLPAWNLVDGNGNTNDTAGHGTDVALIIAALAGNRYGLAGACPMCRVMPVRISSDGRATPALLAAGIDWAVQHGARIITISLAAPGAPDATEQAAVDRATAAGAVVVAAAGNNGNAVPTYPAALRGVVSVTGTDPTNALYSWATRGAWVELAAPGCEYGADMCGSSYAPPVVAAAVGVLLAAAPHATPVQALAALRTTAVPVDGIGGGRIDLRRAAAELGIPQPQPQTAAPSPGAAEVWRGALGLRLTKSLTLAAGMLQIVLSRRDASRCAMTLRSAHETVLSWVGAPDLLALSASLGGGRYTLVAACSDKRRLPYTLSLVTNGT